MPPLTKAIIPPGRFAPARPSQAQLEAVRRLVLDQVAAVEALEPAALRALLPVLKQVRDELRAGLRRWLVTVPDGDERFTAQRYRIALRQVQAAIDAAAHLEPAMADALRLLRKETGLLAPAALEQEIARFGSIFGEAIRPIPIDSAAVMAKGDKLLIPRHTNSAARYAHGVGADIRHQLAVGLARGETFAELKARLVAHGGPRGLVYLRGRPGQPDAISEFIAEGLFKRYRYWAERIVRTESMHAYNAQHDVALRQLNQLRDPDVAEYLRRWDAAGDPRTCPICRSLDTRTAPIGGSFPGGYVHPPAHPHCRCVLVAWHESWGDIEGEVAPKRRRAR